MCKIDPAYKIDIFTCPVQHMCKLNIKLENELIDKKESCF